MTLHQTGGRRRSTYATPYGRDSEERQREPIPRALPNVEAMYTICSLFAICSIPGSEMSFMGPRPEHNGWDNRQTWQKRLKKQTPRLRARRKSWEVSQREAAVYTKFMALSLAPSIKYFVA